MKVHNFPQNIFLWLEFCCSALEEIQHELEKQSQTSQTCSQSSDTMFHCFSAHDSFLDDCIRLRPSNSIFQRVIFRISVYLQPPAAQNRGVWMCFWGVCNGSQQNPFTGSVCGAAYVQNVQKCFGGRKKKTWPLVHFSVFPEGVSRSCAVGAWGTAGDSGWKGVFQLDAFHGCFGKRWWKPGEVKLPVPPPGVLAVSEQTKKERQSESVAAQNVFSLLGINLSENKPPSEFRHSAAPASTQHDSTASDRSRWECSHVAQEGR